MADLPFKKSRRVDFFFGGCDNERSPSFVKAFYRLIIDWVTRLVRGLGMSQFSDLNPWRNVVLAIVMLAATRCLLFAESPTLRARHPRWDRVPPGIFFDDAFGQGLRGPRPAQSAHTVSVAEPTSSVDPPIADADPTSWSKKITSATMEDEMKAIEQRLRAAVASEGQFKAQGFREVGADLATAAALFAIISQYDESVRWQSSASAMGRRLARSAANTRIGTKQVYRDVRQRQQELFELIRGGQIRREAGDDFEWSAVADRALLMKRLKRAVEQLAADTSSVNQLEGRSNAITHEAEIVAAIGKVLIQSGMEDADDDEYKVRSEAMADAASSLRDAVQRGETQDAQLAVGTIKKSCDACHEIYR